MLIPSPIVSMVNTMRAGCPHAYCRPDGGWDGVSLQRERAVPPKTDAVCRMNGRLFLKDNEHDLTTQKDSLYELKTVLCLLGFILDTDGIRSAT